MKEFITDRAKWWVENEFYYLHYPNEQETSVWTDRDGKSHFLIDMELDHL
jgi:hypothetical protein